MIGKRVKHQNIMQVHQIPMVLKIIVQVKDQIHFYIKRQQLIRIMK
jgi:hypothetical protein